MTTRHDVPDTCPHDTHDRLLVAARAAGDLAGRDLDRAERLVATCDGCRDLLGDLRAIATATRGLPAPVRPPAADFRLTPERAASLARGAWWRRLLRPFARPGGGVVRPLAATLTTLGLAGLLLAALPMLPLGGSAAGPAGAAATAEARDTNQGAYGAAVAPTGDPSMDPLGLKVAAPVATGSTEVPAVGAAGSEAASDPVTANDRDAGSGGPAPLVILSGTFLGAGLGLFLLRRAALRVR